MKRILLGLFSGALLVTPLVGQTPAPLEPPPQDQGLPYTRSGPANAMKKLQSGITIFPGSRYGYIDGKRVRLSSTDLLRAEAFTKDGDTFVPREFAVLIGNTLKQPVPIPGDLQALADRWVYAPEELTPEGVALPQGVPTADRKGEAWVSFEKVAEAKGLKVTKDPSGVVHAGKDAYDLNDPVQKEAVITMFDTPAKLADPDIATKYIPSLKRQGKWTDHVKATPEQLAMLNGPETDWPTTPKSEYNESGINTKLLGSKVPAPGVYPRLLFSEADIPFLAERVKSTLTGKMSLIEMEALFKKTWWDPKTSDGAVFEKLSTGNLADLTIDMGDTDKGPVGIRHSFKGQKAGIYNSHVAYVPECLTAMALYAILTQDDALGKKVATAVASYYSLVEPVLDQFLKISDSEWGSSLRTPDGKLIELNGAGATTHWRNMHGVAANMNLGLSLDFSGKWMTQEQKNSMYRVIAKATYGRRSYGQDGPARFRDVNWMAWDLPHYIAVSAVEGLPACDPEALASGRESVRAFCDFGIDPNGVVYESNGKTPGSFQFEFLSIIITARRGENLLAHPHWRRLFEGQAQMTSPSGKVIPNSGTQYVPHSRQRLSLNLVRQVKSFYPETRMGDFLLTNALQDIVPGDDDSKRQVSPEKFDPEAYRKMAETWPRLRLPSITYPGFVRAVLYDSDVIPTTRKDVKLPNDFNAPVHGVFSSYSDATPNATWINMMVRPDHYLGAGHHHADAGIFHFSALGVDWITESPFTQWYTGNVHNLVIVDGQSEPAGIDGVNGYNGAATYLGATSTPSAAAGVADLSYAYSWRWNTQPSQVWPENVVAMNWELDPSPNIAKIFAGTARYKIRPWWTNYTYSNYLPTSRASFNPMQYVYRTTALVRGAKPYGVVVDDLKKDDQVRHYQWTACLNGGVWQANVAGLPNNAIALAWSGSDTNLANPQPAATITPAKGQPLLLVYALGMTESGDASLPLIRTERVEGQADKKGTKQYYDQLAIHQKKDAVSFRVLLLPITNGESLPQVSYDAKSGVAQVKAAGTTDTVRFEPAPKGPTSVVVERGKAILLDTKKIEQKGFGSTL